MSHQRKECARTKEGYAESTITTRAKLLRILAKRGANLLDPESIKETIARQEWCNKRKVNAADAYTAFLRMNGGKWDPPKYKFAEKLGVLEDAVKETFMEREFPGYARLGDMLIKKTKLKEIQEKIEKRLHKGALNLVEASRIIEAEGGRRAVNILDALGYNIEWHGINPHSTKIRKKTKT